MSDSDNDNYIYYGTALEEEVESRAGQHSKAVQDPSLTKSLPVWKQVLLDDAAAVTLAPKVFAQLASHACTHHEGYCM
jgi:hypothetical protein